MDEQLTRSPHRARLELAAEQLLRHPFQGWFYGDSIGFEGLLAASQLLGQDRWSAFVHGFARGWATRRLPFRELDNTAAGRVLCDIAWEERDDTLLEAVRELASSLAARPTIGDGAWVSFARAPLKEPYGGATLPPDEAALLDDPGPGVYVDCLHFDPPFFARLGRRLGDAGLTAAGAAQASAYVSMLQDPETGLFHHFWLERTGRAYVLGWSRGQGWALLGLLDVLEDLPASDPHRQDLLRSLRALAQAMVRTQREDGGWDAVANAPASGTEGSTAAFMAVGLRRGVDAGWLEREAYLPAAQAAWEATLRLLDEEGTLRDVSAAVWSSTADSHYHHVPKGFVVPWGQGPLLIAARLWLGDTDRRTRS